MMMNAARRSDFWLAGWVLALLVTLLAAGLHVYFWRHAGGLWRDEIHLVNLAKQSSLAAMSHDSFPVLMPLLVKMWNFAGLGASDGGLRFFGMLIGFGLPAALWLAAWKFHRSPPLAGLALLALNGTVIVFGDSLRAHGLGSLLILATAISAGWFLKKPSWRRAGVWALLAVLSVQTLFHNALFVAAVCAGAWAVCFRRKDFAAALKVLLVGLAAASSLLPYWSNFVALNSGAGSLRTGIEPGRVLAMFDTAFGYPMNQSRWLWLFLLLVLLVCGSGVLSPVFRRKILPVSKRLPSRWTMLLTALAVAVGFLWFASAPGTRWWFFPLVVLVAAWLEGQSLAPSETLEAVAAPDFTRELALFGGVTLTVAFAGFAWFLWFAALPTEQWYFIPLLALAAGCLEIGLPVRGHLRAAVFGFSAVTVIAAGAVIFSDQRAVNWRFTNVDLLCQRLASESAAGDLVLVSPWYCGLTFERYYQGAASWETVPPLDDHALARYDLIHEKMKSARVVQPLLERVEAALRAGHRVWLVGMMDVPKPGEPVPDDLPPPPLAASGWSDRPYTQNWVLQVNQFLSNHSREFKMVYETPQGNLNFMENLQLYRVEGWRD
jgi:hypothetical protein